MKICIIGLGPLGRRHAEGVISSKRYEVLSLLDLSKNALSESRSFLDNLEANIQPKFCSIEFIQQYSKLKSQYDILIISTTAQYRLSAIEEFYRHSDASFIILEKLLFPAEKDYVFAKNIFAKKNVNVYVNTPRRMWSDYHA